MLLDNLALFLLIVEKGSLTAAGREAGLSPTTVSERLAALEAHYGVVLLNRTTRALSLTDEGRTLADGARQVLNEVGDLETSVRHGADQLSGTIRLSAPSDLGRNIVSAAISNFLSAHPEISVELALSDGYLDIVGQGFDLAVRFGEISDSTLRQRSLGRIRRVVCAAPAYIAAHGSPRVPADLKDHNCLVMRFGGNPDNIWKLGRGGAQQIVTVSGDRIANDGALVRQWGLDGFGIIWKSEIDIRPDLAAGRLVALLPEFEAELTPLQLLFPPGRAQPRRVRAFARHLGDAIAAAMV